MLPEQDPTVLFPDLFDEDGDVFFSGLDPEYNFKSDLEEPTLSFPGVIIDRHYPDDPRNQSKLYIEYTVYTVFKTKLPGITYAQDADGYENGVSRVLRPANTTISGAPFNLDTTPFEDMDGDFVLLEPILGEIGKVHIVGLLPHPGADWRPTKEEGEVFKVRWKGTVVSLDKDGNVSVDASTSEKNVVVKSKDTSISLLPEKLTLTNDSTSVMINPADLTVIAPSSEVKGSEVGLTSPLLKEGFIDVIRYMVDTLNLISGTNPILLPLAAPMTALSTLLGIEKGKATVPTPGTSFTTTTLKAE